MTLSLPLRLFWAAFFLALTMLLGLTLGPAVEPVLFPIRVNQRVEGIHRDRAFLRFVWVNRKLRAPAFHHIDVALLTQRDHFEVTLYSDLSASDAAPCSDVEPWSRSRAVGLGEHDQRFCVELPRSVGPGEAVDLDVTPRYRGFLGLWEVLVHLPPIHSDGADAP